MFNSQATNAIPEELSLLPSLTHVSPVNRVWWSLFTSLSCAPFCIKWRSRPKASLCSSYSFGAWCGLRSQSREEGEDFGWKGSTTVICPNVSRHEFKAARAMFQMSTYTIRKTSESCSLEELVPLQG